jgi:hypothetical protein
MPRSICRRTLVALVAVASASALLFPSGESARAGSLGELVGPYLGLMCPGRTPRLFAPGIVSVSANFEHSAAVFSPDGKELFWCTNVNMRTNPPGEGERLWFMREVDGVWTAPEIAPFTDGITMSVSRPVFSPDGNRLYIEYFSNPIAESDMDIYVVERKADGWSAPVPVSSLINSRAIERLHCVTSDGSLVFSRDPFTSYERVYISRLVDGVFTEPERLGEPFDSASSELAIVLAPDESYMLIAATTGGFTDDLYVSFREPDGSWTERIRAPYESGGFLALSPGGEYLFFLGHEGICWVDTSFVGNLRPAPASGGG